MRGQTKNLSSEELSSIKKELRSSFITTFLIGLMILIIIHLFIFLDSDTWFLPDYEVVLNLGIILPVFLIARISSNNIKKEIDIGKKKIEFLKIDEKYEYQDREDRYSTEYTKYVLKAGGEKFIVSKEEYLTTEISDYVEIHKSYIREIKLKTLIKKNSP